MNIKSHYKISFIVAAILLVLCTVLLAGCVPQKADPIAAEPTPAVSTLPTPEISAVPTPAPTPAPKPTPIKTTQPDVPHVYIPPMPEITPTEEPNPPADVTSGATEKH